MNDLEQELAEKNDLLLFYEHLSDDRHKKVLEGIRKTLSEVRLVAQREEEIEAGIKNQDVKLSMFIQNAREALERNPFDGNAQSFLEIAENQRMLNDDMKSFIAAGRYNTWEGDVRRGQNNLIQTVIFKGKNT